MPNAPTPSRQKMKADARKSAADAPKSNPDVAAQALQDAKGAETGSHVQPVYKTQDKVAGKNTHRGKDKIISEFDDPAGNTVRNSSPASPE